MKKLFMILPLVLVLCFTFSCQQRKEVADEQQNTDIIYGSRYGSTSQTAQWIAEGMERKTDVFAAKQIDIEGAIGWSFFRPESAPTSMHYK